MIKNILKNERKLYEMLTGYASYTPLSHTVRWLFLNIEKSERTTTNSDHEARPNCRENVAKCTQNCRVAAELKEISQTLAIAQCVKQRKNQDKRDLFTFHLISSYSRTILSIVAIQTYFIFIFLLNYTKKINVGYTLNILLSNLYTSNILLKQPLH